MMKFEYKNKGKTIEFEIGKTYYIADWFPTNSKDGKEYLWPLLIECKCIKVDPEDWDTEFQLRGVKNILRSDYKALSYHHPERIMEDEWDYYFHDSLELAYSRFYAEYQDDKLRFFEKIFRPIR